MHKSSGQKGFSIVEISVTMALIGLILMILFIFIPDLQLRARDKERESDLDTLHGRLEEFYQDRGSYPSQILLSQFPRLDPEVLESPDGSMIQNNIPVASSFDALSSANPTKAGPQYTYTAYPLSCTNNCVGYILKTYIESPSAEFSNPYVQGGLHNN